MSNKNSFFSNNSNKTPFGLTFKEKMSPVSHNKKEEATVTGGVSGPTTHQPQGPDGGGFDADVDFG